MKKPNINYSEFFPEFGWLCPFCVAEENEEHKCKVDRRSIPRHLVFHHNWSQDDSLTWEYVYNRLMAIGGV